MNEDEHAGPSGGMAEHLGIEGYRRDPDGAATARMPLSPRVLQPSGIVHGGALAALAETVCSRATYEAVGPEQAAFGQTNETSFLRPISAGTVHAAARPRHRGRTTWVWEVEMTDGEGRLCALSRMTVAVRSIEP